MAGQFARMLAGELPDDWETTLPVFMPDSGEMATRDAGGLAMNALAALPNLAGGSADLDPSTRTVLKGCGDFESPRSQSPDGRATQGTAGGVWGYAGRSIHFGLREHAMAAIMTGMACHGGVLPAALCRCRLGSCSSVSRRLTAKLSSLQASAFG